MSTYEHDLTLRKLAAMGRRPEDDASFEEWVLATEPIELLRQNEHANEVIVHASSMPHILIQAVALPNALLKPPDWDCLQEWSGNPFSSSAGYCSNGDGESVWIERDCSIFGSQFASEVVQLVYGRHFHGLTGEDATYFEILQEFAHLSGIHWRPERHAYCRFDEYGDFDPIVSITETEEPSGGSTLVTFQRDALEDYLAATDSSLVRLFDFTMFTPGEFSGWDGAEESTHAADSMRYRQKVERCRAGFVHGAQICMPSRPREEILRRIAQPPWDGRNTEFATFTAYDWRHQEISEISTDPSATTNYFDADHNDLPFELSPAFFRPEVLSKYKADRDKYTLTERDLTCRSAWHLTAIDVNEAEQVHAYICYLRDLPYNEQLHWQSHNEPPQASISTRAFTTDFAGEFDRQPNPLRSILTTTERWAQSSASWWTLRDPELSKRVSTPISDSLDEWAEACMDLAKLVIEGFETRELRSTLAAKGIDFQKDWRSLALLDALLSDDAAREGSNLPGLRSVQEIRSKVKGHASSREAKRLSTDALKTHRTFAAHFTYLCEQVASELDMIERALDGGV